MTMDRPADQTVDQPADKTAIVTGASDGIGLECAVQLAEQGFRVVLVGRTPAKTAAALERVQAVGGQAESLLCDFSSLDQVRRLADDLLERCPRIDVLISNAGSVFAKRTLTPDGYESTFAVNHLAGFLLIELLKDRIIASAPARVVITASASHYGGTMDFDNLHFAKGYTTLKGYNRSKLANVLHTRHLAKEFEGTNVLVNTLHPGAVSTSIWTGAPVIVRPILNVAKRFMLSAAEGGSRLTYLATDPAVTSSGDYYTKNKVKKPADLARDEILEQRLVETSRELVGLV